MPVVLGRTAPHPSFGFFTPSEFHELSSLNWTEHKSKLKAVKERASVRKRAYTERMNGKKT